MSLSGGDSKTLMIAQIAPVEKNVGESVCSLNFAQRVRSVELGQASRRVENGDSEVIHYVNFLIQFYLNSTWVFLNIIAIADLAQILFFV